ncbi:MAG: DUF302 domain-containing protein [Myxococcaceae bacterium]|nr:DUF302 domain-containing protein [Myxococcaceae bacterium]
MADEASAVTPLVQGSVAQLNNAAVERHAPWERPATLEVVSRVRMERTMAARGKGSGLMTTTTYQAVRRELFFDVSHAAFSAALEELLGRVDLQALTEIAKETPEAARAKLASFIGPLDFALFQKLDHGGVLAAMRGAPTRATTYVFGNALIAVEMTKHDPRAGLYVPLRLFVQESGKDRILVTYDVPSATMAQFRSPEIDAVARSLDEKVQRLIEEAVKRASSRERPPGGRV